MGIWETLDIEPTSDVSTIKKAYAAKLKIHHPEDDPEGYQLLREAYDWAVKNAKLMAKASKQAKTNSEEKTNTPPQEMEHHDQEQKMPPMINHIDDLLVPLENRIENINVPPRSSPFEAASDLPKDFERMNEEFIKKATDLYYDFYSRIKIENWIALFNSDVLWDMNNREAIDRMMLNYISDHKFFPQEIWKLFEATFHLTEKENFRYPTFNGIYEYILKQLNDLRPLLYYFPRKDAIFDYDNYLYLRENAYNYLRNNNLGASQINLWKAREIYPDDPELFYIEAMILVRSDRWVEAADVINFALEINHQNLDYYKLRARIYLQIAKYQSALEDCKKVIQSEPENLEILKYMIKCHYDLREYEDARKQLISLLEIFPADSDSKIMLFQTNKHLLMQLKRDIKQKRNNKEIQELLVTVKKEVSAESNALRKAKTNDLPSYSKKYAVIVAGIIVVLGIFFALNKLVNSKGIYHKTSSSAQQISHIEMEMESEIERSTYFNLDLISNENLPETGTKVKGNVSDIIMLGLKNQNSIDKYGNIIPDFSALGYNVSSQKLFDNDGWVYVGKAGGKKYIIVSDPANFIKKGESITFNFAGSVAKINKTSPIAVIGTIKALTSSYNVVLVKSALKTNGYTDEDMKTLVTDKYLVLDNNESIFLPDTLNSKHSSPFASIAGLPIAAILFILIAIIRKRR